MPLPIPSEATLRTLLVDDGLSSPDPGRAEQGAWWSRRWIQALESIEAFGAYGRGKAAARRDLIVAIHIEPGIVLAQTQCAKPAPCIVRVDMAPLPPETWDRIITGMAQKAVFAAKLLAGELPEETEEAFSEAGASLLPESAADIPSSCTCGEAGHPCRHIAVVHYVIADEFSRDPFLLFKLRGCPKAELLAALRVKRVGSGATDVPSAEPEAAAPSPQAFWHAGDAVSDFAINIAPPMTHASLLRQLGAPPIEDGEPFLELMAAIYQRVMQSVLEDALKGQRPGPPVPMPAPSPAKAG